MKDKSYGLYQQEIDSIMGNLRGLQIHLAEITQKMTVVETTKALKIDAILYEPMRAFIIERFQLSLDGTKETQEEEYNKFLKRKDVKILVEFFEYLKKRQNI